MPPAVDPTEPPVIIERINTTCADVGSPSTSSVEKPAPVWAETAYATAATSDPGCPTSARGSSSVTLG